MPLSISSPLRLSVTFSKWMTGVSAIMTGDCTSIDLRSHGPWTGNMLVMDLCASIPVARSRRRPYNEVEAMFRERHREGGGGGEIRSLVPLCPGVSGPIPMSCVISIAPAPVLQALCPIGLPSTSVTAQSENTYERS
jgi:hypothetical protein